MKSPENDKASESRILLFKYGCNAALTLRTCTRVASVHDDSNGDNVRMRCNNEHVDFCGCTHSDYSLIKYIDLYPPKIRPSKLFME